MKCGTRVPRSDTASDRSNVRQSTAAVASSVRAEPRRRMTVSRSSDAGRSPSTGGAVGHGSPSTSPSPACWASVTSGNSTGATSIAPVAASPPGPIAGAPRPRVTMASGNSCVPSAPTSRATAASGKRVRSRGR